jgi:hypothetical protein
VKAATPLFHFLSFMEIVMTRRTSFVIASSSSVAAAQI